MLIMRCMVDWLEFQFTPLREGRRDTDVYQIYMADFNSRPSARGDDLREAALQMRIKFQFTPLREGRRQRQATPPWG